jgi:hypothetical protein
VSNTQGISDRCEAASVCIPMFESAFDLQSNHLNDMSDEQTRLIRIMPPSEVMLRPFHFYALETLHDLIIKTKVLRAGPTNAVTFFMTTSPVSPVCQRPAHQL